MPLKRIHFVFLLTLIAVFILPSLSTLQAQPSLSRRQLDQVRRAWIYVPPGFTIRVWANEPGITAMTFDDEGRMFASTIFGGQILILDDADYNGTAEIRTVFAGGLDTPLGLVFAGEKLFVTARHQIFALQDTNHDDQADSVESVVEGLPVGNPGTTQSIHQTNGIVLGPDGLLYVSQGAVGNAEELTQPWEGAVFTVDPTTYQQSLFAEGFRNPYALVFDAHGHLLVTDNGADHLDEYELEDAPDELNWVQSGQHYGHPYYFDTLQNPPAHLPIAPPDLVTTPPTFAFAPHVSANGVAPWLDNKLFVAHFVTGRLMQVVLDWSSGAAVHESTTSFAVGLRSPLAVAASPDGQSLFVSDFLSGPIYQITCDPAVIVGCPDVPIERPPIFLPLIFGGPGR